MGYHTFGPGVAFDNVTGDGLNTVTARLQDADTGDELQAYTLDEDPQPRLVTTNRRGYFGEFKVPDTVRRVMLVLGNLSLPLIAHEVIAAAPDALDLLDRFTISHVALDEDGQPYFAPGTGTVQVLPDTDGKPYYIPS